MLLRASVAVFLSSTAMFVLEPTVGRMILPHAGGGPSVWAACLVFFQAALLLGYLASHALTTRLAPKRQAIVVCAVLALGLVFLPTRIGDRASSSALGVLASLTLAAGTPFLALSMIAPTLQRWHHAVEPDREPYVLYAASNAGSLAALIAYPFLEPFVGLRAITVGVTVVYVALVAAVVVAAMPLRKVARVDGDDDATDPVPAAQAARWALLAFVPSAYLAAVTTHLTVEVAPVPLLWTIPLALYISTFVVAFAGWTRASTLAARALPFFAVAIAFLLVTRIVHPPVTISAVHLAAFFVAALACHGELARLRPHASQLTSYYVWIAAGGAAGSVFVSLLAPLLFDQYLEYPLLLLFALTIRPGAATARAPRVDVLFALGIGVVSIATTTFARSQSGVIAVVLFPGVALAVALVAMNHARRFALSVALVLATAGVYGGGDRTLFRERNFFGTLRVSKSPNGAFVVLTNGTTVHGRQFADPAKRRQPISYYGRSGPAADLFDLARADHLAEDVVIVGLGTGTIAAYALPGERWTFLEIDPAVIRIARDPALFTFLTDAFPKGDYTVREGDARIALQSFDRPVGLLVVDAFAGDAIPTHLLTVEAGRLYADKARLVALHVSNRYADLAPTVARLARDIGWIAMERDDDLLTDEQLAGGLSPSDWIVLGPSSEALAGIGDQWVRLQVDDRPAWTDDRASVITILR